MSDLRATTVIQTLVRRRESVACAESLTGGLVTSTLIAPMGASEVVRGGITAYSTDAKHRLLYVPHHVVAEHGTVSKPTAVAMAQGAQKQFDTTWALATTGVAGPGEHEGQGAGTVFIALIGAVGSETINRVEKHELTGNRDENRLIAAQLAVELLALELDS